MDPDLKREVLDVRKVIEKSTSKVSLRDLEKKGFRQVKVLRAGDINQLIFKAVQNVLAKQPRGGGGMSEEERQQIVAEAQAEVDRQLAEKRELQQQSQAIEEKRLQLEEAHKKLEQKLAEVNAQLANEKRAFLEEKAALAREKQALMERSLEGQKLAAASYDGQLKDLKERLAKAEARAEAAAGAVSQEEHEQVRRRFTTQIDDLQTDCERYRKQLRQLEEQQQEHDRGAKRREMELEESEARAQAKARALGEELEKLRAEVAANGNQGGATHDAEVQRLRMEMEQRQQRMQEMMAGIASTLVEVRKGGGGGGGGEDFSKQFERLQRGISDAVRKAAGKGKDEFSDLTAEQAGAIFANMEIADVQTNINDVKLKESSAAGVKDKLAKLRNLRKQ